MAIDQLELPPAGRGEAPRGRRSGEATTTAQEPERPGADDLMSQGVERSNLAWALERVRQNKRSADIDGMAVDELVPYLQEHWATNLGSLQI